jgi:hypothetical protein
MVVLIGQNFRRNPLRVQTASKRPLRVALHHYTYVCCLPVAYILLSIHTDHIAHTLLFLKNEDDNVITSLSRSGIVDGLACSRLALQM